MDLTGEKYLYEYSSQSYEITILSAKRLHWRLSKGESEGPTEDEEDYWASDIAPGIIYISWDEASGLALSNVMNFNDSVLTTHARFGGDVFVNPGKVSKRD